MNRYLREFLKPCLKLWDEAAEAPPSSRNLLRLVVLREMIRRLHAERSSHLASQELDKARLLRDVEPWIEELRKIDLSKLDIVRYLETPQDARLKAAEFPRPLSIDLLRHIPREKLERFDRAWEREIAAEAMTAGWTLVALEADVDPLEAERFHHALSDSIWPRGTVLFVETRTPPSGSNPGTLWPGKWWIVQDPSEEFPLAKVGLIRGLYGSPRLVLLYARGLHPAKETAG